MNLVDRQILEEGWRNAVVKLTGILDTSDVSEISVISPQDFTNNDRKAGTVSGFRVDHITYSISNALEVVMEWNGQNPQQIVPLAGRGKIDSTDDGGFIPDSGRMGYDGSINLKTTGWVTGTPHNFTIFLRLVKLYSG